MKKILLILIFLVGTVPAQIDSTANKLNDVVENIFSLSKKANYKKACNFIVYTGNNSERKYTSKLNPKTAEDLNRAERLLKKIKAYMDISDSYEIAGTSKTTEESTDITTVEVSFKSGKQTLKIEFNFVNINNEFLLAGLE